MSKKITAQMERLISTPIWVHAGVTAAAFVLFNQVKGRLDASYAASNHPVDYATGQTTFSGEAIKGFYAHMQEFGTLDVYSQTQLIDFGFIVTMMILAFCLGSLAARLGPDGGYGRRLGKLAGVSVIFGAIFDIFENLVSFVMLADPTGFPDFIALPYSAFAAIKFALIAVGLLLLLASFVVGLIERIAPLLKQSRA